MVLQTTPRLKLTYDNAEGQPVGTQGSNWDKVDWASGVITETTAAPVAEADKYDGAIIANSDTGISYLCIPDGAGGWTKKYINYPWLFCATDAAGFINNATTTSWGWATLSVPNCINAGGADLVPTSFELKFPIKALYSVMAHCTWPASPGTGVGIRSLQLAVNDVIDVSTEERLKPNNNSGVPTHNQLRIRRVFNAGDRIGGRYTQNSGAAIGMTAQIFATLVRPIW